MVANFGVDTAENEPLKVSRYMHAPPPPGHKFRSAHKAATADKERAEDETRKITYDKQEVDDGHRK